MKILLVEDDESTSLVLSEALVAHYYTVDVAKDGRTGLDLATSFEYDLILLDLLIPKLDGITLCCQLRSQGYQKPIVLLTAKDADTDIVTGLDVGADDYILKPYNLSELMARIRALLRRGSSTITPVLTWEDLCLNPVAGEVTYKQQPICLTPKEYLLLELFLRNPQRLYSRSAIIERLWSIDNLPIESAITVHIKDLRQKLKAAGLTAEIIETVYGLGYRLKSPPVPEKRDSSTATPKRHHQESKAVASATSQYQSKGLASVNKILDRFRDTFTDQIAVLEQALVALQTNHLTSSLRLLAKQEAHKLAGSLGIFGYPQASQLARKTEHLLIDEAILGKEKVLRLRELVVALKQELTKPPTPLAVELTSLTNTQRVLVVDDDIALTTRLKTEAVSWGMQVEVATDLTSARIAIASTPDVMLLELDFPHTSEDGLTLLAQIAQQYPHIPVVVLTKRNSLEDRVAVSRLGGRGFLHKPQTSQQIFTAINQVLPQAQASEARVMIVDDDPAILVAFTHLLQPWGLQVNTLDNSQQFWDVLNATAPDLLVLDLEMPKFNGIDLCKVVRQDPQWGDLPMLVVTAHTDAESIQQVFAAGADDFIAKPVVGPEFVTRIMSRIEQVKLRRKLEEIKRHR